MNININMSLARADELLGEMKREYEQSLNNHVVSPRAVHFTHEVCERLRSVLDRVARLYWETHISPSLEADDREKALIYFPVTKDKNSFNSTMGRWRWASVKAQHTQLEQHLLTLQPFSSQANDWLRTLSELAAASKHIDLIPQKRMEERRITVSGSGGQVSWGPGVIFGSGVSIMGAPVDPRTQRIVFTPGITERVEVWVSFIIEGYGVDALRFCSDACQQVRAIIQHMTKEFTL